MSGERTKDGNLLNGLINLGTVGALGGLRFPITDQ
jgi:hypothetical protein